MLLQNKRLLRIARSRPRPQDYQQEQRYPANIAPKLQLQKKPAITTKFG